MLRSVSASQQALEEQLGQACLGREGKSGTTMRMATRPEWWELARGGKNLGHRNKRPVMRREQSSLCGWFRPSERRASQGCFGLGNQHVEVLASFLDRAWSSEKNRSA